MTLSQSVFSAGFFGPSNLPQPGLPQGTLEPHYRRGYTIAPVVVHEVKVHPVVSHISPEECADLVHTVVYLGKTHRGVLSTR